MTEQYYIIKTNYNENLSSIEISFIDITNSSFLLLMYKHSFYQNWRIKNYLSNDMRGIHANIPNSMLWFPQDVIIHGKEILKKLSYLQIPEHLEVLL